jgi:NAD+ synthase (glutamine-hydrolysing)
LQVGSPNLCLLHEISVEQMKIAIAQLNCIVGDLAGNAQKILVAAESAQAQGANLLITPELSIAGYPPEDLLLRDSFMRDCAATVEALVKKLNKINVLVGYPLMQKGKRYNAAALLGDGKIKAIYRKFHLPNYNVFDEERYFEPHDEACVFDLDGVKFGVTICEDVWLSGPALRAKQAGAEILLAMNASPFHIGKEQVRYDVVRERISECGIPIVFANLVGGQDELVFDGGSFAMDAQGSVTHQFAPFETSLEIIEVENKKLVPGKKSPTLSTEAAVYKALCVGVRDYITKNGFPGVLLGLSGGVDSALTIAVAVDALGADKVHAVMMPSPYTAQISIDDSREMVKILGVKYSEISINPVFESFKTALAKEFVGKKEDTTEENIQARIRGTMLMALSNKFGSIVITTGNKSEMAVGYCTLYGDMAGGFAVLKDISKTLVYKLCEYRNSISPVIPTRVITRAPSAELRENQTDQDSLPPYDILDAIMERYMEQNQSAREIVAAGFKSEDVTRITKLIKHNEYKRRQSPVGVRITARGFGRDWRYPITSRYAPDL